MEIFHTKMKVRRDALRAEGRCICGPVIGHISRNGVAHGPVLRGGKCARCLAVWRGLHRMEPSAIFLSIR